MQRRLKSAARHAPARIIATEFLDEFLASTNDAITATFATDLESNRLRGALF
jgi:hypothetical protein